jgi:hypothetical protein
MSSFFAVINNEVEGPIEMSQLKEMAAAGTIRDDSLVSSANAPDHWLKWADVNPSRRVRAPILDAIAVAGVSPQKQSPETAASTYITPEGLGRLRRYSAYPILRSVLIILLILSGIGFVLSGVAAFDEGSRPMAIIGMLTSLGSAFSTLIIGVLLDIADCLLRKP